MGHRDDRAARAARRAWLDDEIARLAPDVAQPNERATLLAERRSERAALDEPPERITSSASGWEWLAFGALVVVLFLGAALAVALVVLAPLGHHPDLRSTARTDAHALRSAVLLYWGSEPGRLRHCPTTTDLLASGTIDGTRTTTDPWGTPFRIVCDGDDVRVVSAGPDGVFGADDVE